MSVNRIEQSVKIEPSSYIWHEYFVESKIPDGGIVVETAPGYEPKVGNALSLLNFKGILYVIEPDPVAANYILRIYKMILPGATIFIVRKYLQDVVVGKDIPRGADALVASHPFDDMVIAFLAGQTSFFSRERECGAVMTGSAKDFYEGLSETAYEKGVRAVFAIWKDFIAKSKPVNFIASQYPSRTLKVKGLNSRQESGFAVLRRLKKYYQGSLKQYRFGDNFGFKGDPKWWISAYEPRVNFAYDLKMVPEAIGRLGEQIFVKETARRLKRNEYDVIYIDHDYFKNTGCGGIEGLVHNFAITFDNGRSDAEGRIITFSDRQKDKTDIGLCGNIGSGRAVYYGDKFNILGVGKTSLCKSGVPSHSTGRTDLMGAIRRIILSKWINNFTNRAPLHPVLIALKETARYKWNPVPVPLALLVRVDGGSLDRPSHVEYSPNIAVDFQKVLTEYARLDAECFAFRILFGAWSTGNYSLSGRMIDLETASFVKYRSPYFTASGKRLENRFGYEGIGLLKVLRQLANAKNINMGSNEIEKHFYAERRRHLGRCFLSLLGVGENAASIFFAGHENKVMMLADRFENLAKKICPRETNLNLYTPVSDKNDPALLDMSELFRNLSEIRSLQDGVRETAFDCMVRRNSLSQVKTAAKRCLRSDGVRINKVELFLRKNAVVTRSQLPDFLRETKRFIHDLLQIISMLESGGYLENDKSWRCRLRVANQDFPAMHELNDALAYWIERYRLKRISPAVLGARIKKFVILQP